MLDVFGFGMLNSHIHRRMIMKKMIELNMGNKEVFMVYFFAAIVKSRDRILRDIQKFSDKSWHRSVTKFFRDHTVQYTTEKRAVGDKIAVINIPSSNPSLTMLIHCTFLCEALGSPMDTLWFGQLNLNAQMQEKHLQWEKNFWDNVVTKSKNPNANAYERGFKLEYYEKKALDKYPLLHMDGTQVLVGDEGYDEADITTYIETIKSTMSKVVSRASTAQTGGSKDTDTK